jgi:hypothetical protein
MERLANATWPDFDGFGFRAALLVIVVLMAPVGAGLDLVQAASAGGWSSIGTGAVGVALIGVPAIFVVCYLATVIAVYRRNRRDAWPGRHEAP